MKLARGDFLSNTGLARKRHRCGRILDTLQLRLDGPHRGGASKRFAACRVTSGGDLPCAQSRNLSEQGFDLKGLRDVIVGTSSHQTYSLFDFAECGVKYDWGCTEIWKSPAEQLLSVEIWQPDVADKDLAGGLPEMRQRLFPRSPSVRAIAL